MENMEENNNYNRIVPYKISSNGQEYKNYIVRFKISCDDMYVRNTRSLVNWEENVSATCTLGAVNTAKRVMKQPKSDFMRRYGYKNAKIEGVISIYIEMARAYIPYDDSFSTATAVNINNEEEQFYEG